MFEVCVLGTSAAVPAHGRHLSAQVVHHNDRLFLVDCGEGTQFQLRRYRQAIGRLDGIFISHLHGDHLLGLPGLLNSLSMMNREAPLPVVGPPGLREYLELQFRIVQAHFSYSLDIREIEPTAAEAGIFRSAQLRVHSFPLVHRVPTMGFRFEEAQKQAPINPHKAKALDVPPPYLKLLKNGNTITLKDGRRIKPEQVLDAAPPPSVYCYCSDTAYSEDLVSNVRGANLLFHEATFLDERAERALKTRHTTARQAGQLAAKAGVNGLLLGHFSARYPNPEVLEAEASAEFRNVRAAKEGWVYDVASGGRQNRPAI